MHDRATWRGPVCLISLSVVKSQCYYDMFAETTTLTVYQCLAGRLTYTTDSIVKVVGTVVVVDIVFAL